MESILRRVIRRTAKALVGYHEELESEADALAALQAAEVDRRLRYPDPFPHVRRSASLDGFSLHAAVRIHENDREGRERLCRYLLRPPFALHRLSQGEDGRLVYRMKRPRGGPLLLVLTPDELLARIATLVPPPRVHGLRFHGAFAPNSKARKRVVPVPSREVSATTEPMAETARGRRRKQRRARPEEPPRTYRIPWAQLLKKVFALDVLACPKCDGRMRIIAFIAQPAVARRVLDHLGPDSTGPPLAGAQVQPELLDPGPDYSPPDPIYPE